MNPKKRLIDNAKQLQQDFEKGIDIHQLLIQRSQLIDQLLIEIWDKHHLADKKIAALVAVGGYGREEMHPASDIDLLLLLNSEPNTEEQEQLSNFVTALWDLGLEVGHSVRTLEECREEAEKDLTVITNLMESRLIKGNQTLFQSLQQQIQPSQFWSSHDFFIAKQKEQKKRYQHYGDSAYRVEPNLKEGPGGLRDIQMISWIIQREYNHNSLSTLIEEDIISPAELSILVEGHDFLWRVRFVLHQLAGRKEDRLLFNYQRDLAHQFGFKTDEGNQCIESFMQQYYRTITSLERITEVVLGMLREDILSKDALPSIRINHHYLNTDGYLCLTSPLLFQKHPHTLLEVFYTLQIIPNMKGMSPNTIRAIRDHIHLVDHEFRNNNYHKKLFIRIMSAAQGITFVLRQMNRYGILAAYIPAFSNIVGRMQYDLFHIYTVDEHTLKVIRNLRRLSTSIGAEELPFCSQIFHALDKPYLLYLAALFHDIAKGRGGSHSEKGAVDALDFCRAHEMNEHDAQTVSWLVEQHLEMSSIAQRKDIFDPDVILEFAEKVSLLSRLDYLYLLTISDIKGTNSTLLNSWKHTLLKDLYENTRYHLQNKTSASITSENIILEKKNTLLKKIKGLNIKEQDCYRLWDRLGNDYILHIPIDIMFWHMTQLVGNEGKTIIAIEQDCNNNSSTLLLIYTKTRIDFFARITSAIEQLCLNIVAARIYSTQDEQYALDTLHLLNMDSKLITDPDDIQRIKKAVAKSLSDEHFSFNPQHFRQARQLKYFDTPTRVHFNHNKARQQTIITITTSDSPGLLTRISQVFYQQDIQVHSARITTLGEQAEDIFNITRGNHQLLDDPTDQEKLTVALQEAL
ncbi:MAG: [protein-PII] uridylyltransferase [Cocleimonas sp.]|nr:[protein-PII] uridylyltransferase [Cocleimonas sp.]